MDILNELKSRRSIRAYTEEAVSKADLDKIIEAGLFAASGMGRQASTIVCITNKEIRDQLSKLNAKVMGKEDIDPFYGAQTVLAVLAQDIATCVADGALILGNMMNEAGSLGLGSCWIHRAKEVFEFPEGIELKKKWNIPEDYKGVGFLIVGHPQTVPAAIERKPNRVVFAE
ncbi:MAG: nitroreductase [Treponema sp.]|nr:nitroreductase [Candidatus Treponema equifaecale]